MNEIIAKLANDSLEVNKQIVARLDFLAILLSSIMLMLFAILMRLMFWTS